MSRAAKTETKPTPKGRWWRRSLFALLLAVLAFPAYVVYEEIQSRRPGVTIDNFRRIKVGMTMDEVEARLGPRSYERKNEPWGGEEVNPKTLVWEGTELDIDVDFSKEGKVNGTRHFWRRRPAPADDSFFDRIRRWIRFH